MVNQQDINLKQDDVLEDVFIENKLKPNRGALINTGVRMALEDGCDYVVIQRFDLIPNNELIKEYCVFPTNPVNISSILPKYNHIDYRTKPQWSIQLGIIKISIQDFISIHGYPNDMWGMGYDDYVFLERCRVNNIQLNTLVKPPGAQLIDKNIMIIDPNNNMFNTIGLLQINKENDIYLSTDISGAAQNVWFNITNMTPFMERLVLANIELDYTLIRPFKSIILNNYIIKLKNSSDKLNYTNTVLDLIEKALLYIVGIDFKITDRTIVDYGVLFNIPKISYMGNPDYLDNFENRLFVIHNLIKSVIKSLYTDDLFDMNGYIPTYFDIGVNVNPLNYIEIYVNFGFKELSARFNSARHYLTDNKYITYQQQPIRTIPINNINQYTEELKWFRSDLNAKYQILYNFVNNIPVASGYNILDPGPDTVILNYQNLFNENIQNIIDKIIIDAFGKYVFTYNPIKDDIDVYDLIDNKYTRIYDTEELQKYNSFYSIIVWKLRINYKKYISKFSKKTYDNKMLKYRSSQSESLEEEDIETLFEPSSPTYVPQTPPSNPVEEEDIETLFEPSSPTYVPQTPPSNPVEEDIETKEEPCEGTKKKKCLQKEDCEWVPSGIKHKHGKCKKKIVLKGGVSNSINISDIVNLKNGDRKIVTGIDDNEYIVSDENGENASFVTLDDIQSITNREDIETNREDIETNRISLMDIKLKGDN